VPKFIKQRHIANDADQAIAAFSLMPSCRIIFSPRTRKMVSFFYIVGAANSPATSVNFFFVRKNLTMAFFLLLNESLIEKQL